MPTYAIVETGGKQYRVEKGQSLLVDRISEEEGAKVPLRAVMFRSDDDTVLAAKDLEKVASLPTRDQARAQLLGLLTSPAQQLAAVIAAPAQDLVRVFAAFADKRKGEAGAAA